MLHRVVLLKSEEIPLIREKKVNIENNKIPKHQERLAKLSPSAVSLMALPPSTSLAFYIASLPKCR